MQSLVIALVVAQAAILAIDGNDPVSLCEGQTVAGKVEWTARHGRFEYRFSSQENLDRFQKEPERWGVQHAGACGKMGTLSGLGSPSRWAVHKGRIYLFASDGCRKTFLADPDRHIDRPDASFEPTQSEREAGVMLLKKSAAYLKLEPKPRTILQWEVKTPYKTGDKTEYYEVTSTFSPSGLFMTRAKWGTSVFEDAVDGERGRRIEKGVTFPIAPVESMMLVRMFTNKPLVAVALGVDPEARVRHLGQKRPHPDVPMTEACEVWYRGTTYQVFVDDQGKVVALANRQRVTGPYQNVVDWFQEYRESAGMMQPFSYRRSIDGGALSESKPLTVAAKLP